MEALDLAIRNLFQEFQETALKRVSLQRMLHDEGTITRKTVKGKEYWYRQHYVKGQARQEYIGRSTSEIDHKIISLKRSQKEQKNLIRSLTAQETRRIPLFRRSHLPILDSLVSSLLEKLSQSTLIYKGGVLAGSYAFTAYAGLLGWLFDKESLKTFDIDLVHDAYRISKEAPLIHLVGSDGEFVVRGKKFHSVPGFSHKALPSSFIGPDGLRVDFLTPLRGKPRTGVPLSDVPHVEAQPLHFLDFLIKHPVDTVLLGNSKGIAVTVPDPCRYAIHKLIVAAKRPVSETAKRHKDLSQASQLILVCSEERPDELKKVYREAMGRGPGWKKALTTSLHSLSEEIIKLF